MSSARGRVNQQIAWCHQLLTQFQSSELPWVRQVLVQSLGWHLQSAYVALLQELADAFKFPVNEPGCVEDLIRVVPSGRAVPAELGELSRLAAGESWLSNLLALPGPAATQVSATGNQASGSVIATSGSPSFDMGQAQSALFALQEFIDRNRQLSDES
ncbi:DUF6586 family protein [Simiduia aestuariiviva]|uniref:DUF6586 family protein n=1 Tax=Simiduia aestuariiviva TaxID=1510459 RepID=UPI0031B5AA19